MNRRGAQNDKWSVAWGPFKLNKGRVIVLASVCSSGWYRVKELRSALICAAEGRNIFTGLFFFVITYAWGRWTESPFTYENGDGERGHAVGRLLIFGWSLVCFRACDGSDGFGFSSVIRHLIYHRPTILTFIKPLRPADTPAPTPRKLLLVLFS